MHPTVSHALVVDQAGEPAGGTFLGSTFPGCSDEIEMLASRTANQAFLRVVPRVGAPVHTIPLGRPADLRRFNASYRSVSCWMLPRTGRRPDELPAETQFVLVDRGADFLVLYPLVDGPVRTSLETAADGVWTLRLETGSSKLPCCPARCLFAAAGADPFVLVQQAAAAICQELGTARLRVDKETPRFVDLPGWCTWDAFYEEVSERGIMDLLSKFKTGGVTPGWVILDAGWQHVEDGVVRRFEADPVKFPDGLRATVDRIKTQAGVEQVLAWQSYNGYWQGTSPELLGEDASEARHFSTPDHLLDRIQSDPNAPLNATVGESFYPSNLLHKPNFLPRGSFFALYDRMHGCMRDNGIDGVKIDAMTWAEAFGEERGGRTAVMRDLVRSAEASAGLHLGGVLIHCSACSNDFLYHSLRSPVVRTSGDYFPEVPASHGQHLVTNAMVSCWAGEFVLPDWDMFQSGHAQGYFHAAARSLSGGPIYVSDRAGRIDTALLRRLRLSNGTVPRCLRPARPTLDCLFSDPVRERVPLKIFNFNPAGAVLGAFNCHVPHPGDQEIAASFGANDLPGGQWHRLAAWSERGQSLHLLSDGETLDFLLPALGCEIVTVSPVVDGFAPIGNVDLLNPGGAIASHHRSGHHHELRLRDGGSFVAWCESRPTLATANGHALDPHWEPSSRCLILALPMGQPIHLVLEVPTS